MNDKKSLDTIKNGMPVIIDDQIIELAERAEKRIDAVNKIKRIALKVTNVNDWVDQNGKPYLQASGGEKIARLFGISWQIEEPVNTDLGDGHFQYTYKGTFSMGGATIDAIGVRDSKDGFFTTRYNKEGQRTVLPGSEVDKSDVKKAALTNLIGNGITRLLGIRNLTYEDLAEVGIKKETITRFKYKEKKKSTPSEPAKNGKDDLKPFESVDDFQKVSDARKRGILKHLYDKLADEKKEEFDKATPVPFKDMDNDDMIDTFSILRSLAKE